METTQNTPDSDTQATVNGVKQPPPKKHFKIRKSHRRAMYGVAVLLVGVITAGYFLVYKPANDYVIKVGEVKVTQEAYDRLIAEAKEDPWVNDKKDAVITKQIVEFYSNTEALRIIGESNLVEDKNDLATKFYNTKYEDLNSWQTLTVDSTVSQQRAGYLDSGAKRAVLIGAGFNSLFVKTSLPENLPAGYGDPVAIAKEKQGAKELVESYHSRVSKKQMTPIEAFEDRMQQLKYPLANSAIFAKYVTASDQGDIYNSVSAGEVASYYVTEGLAELTEKGQFTEVRTLTSDYEPASLPPGYEHDGEIAYYFMALQEVIPAQKGILDKYNDTKNNIEVRIEL